MNISNKLLLSIGFTTVALFMVTTIYIAKLSAENTKEQIYKEATSSAKYHGINLQRNIYHSLGILNSLNIMMTRSVIDKNTNREHLSNTLKNVLKKSTQDYIGIWTLWKPNAYDGLDDQYKNTPFHDSTGRLNSYWHQHNGEITHENSIHWENASWYVQLKQQHKPVLLDPYPYVVSGQEVTLLTLASPLYINHEFVGVVGIDFNIERLSSYVNNIKVLTDSPATILSNDASFVAGNKIPILSPTAKAHVKAGEEYIEVIWDDKRQDNIHLIYTPIKVSGTDLSWSLTFTVPEKHLYAPVIKFTQFTIVVSILSITILLFLCTFIIRRVLSLPITRLESAVTDVSSGNFDVQVAVKSNDEISALSLAFNKMTKNLKTTNEKLNISEQKAHRLNIDLEHKVLERTAKIKLASELLAKEKEKAEQSNHAKSQFLANMSHEIRTPLNGIIGAHHIMKSSSLSPEQHELIEDSLSTANSLLGILNDILDFSKIEAKKLTIEEKNVGLENTLQQVLNLASLSATSQGIHFDVTVSNDLPQQIKIDALRLTQILLNLLSNAIKFTPHGRVSLSVNKSVSTSNDLTISTLVFMVKDTGIGISHAQIEQLFKPFEQAELNSSRRYGGTGLGLSISKSLAEQMGGKIEVSSILGSGSTFTLTLPCKPCNSTKIIDNHIIEHTATDLLIDSLHIRKGLRQLFQQLKQKACFIKMEDLNNENNNNHRLLLDKNALEQLSEKQIVHINSHYKYIFKITGPENELAQNELTKVREIHINKRINWPLLPQKLIACLNMGSTVNALKKGSDKPTLSQALSKYKILLADDVLINRKLLERMLQKYGANVDLVDNGIAVLSAMEKQQYDIILMDLHMPEMDGFEATKIIKSREEYNNVRIIALTADVLDSTKKTCDEIGMDGFVTKPFEPKKLLDTMLNTLRKIN